MMDAQMKAVISQSTAEQKSTMTFGMVERPHYRELVTTKCHGFKQHLLLNPIDFVKDPCVSNLQTKKIINDLHFF